MSLALADRGLLFGILALRKGAITPDQFVEAMKAWSPAKDPSLAQLLCERGVISEQDRTSLEALADEHLAGHGGSAAESLRALTSLASAKASGPGAEAAALGSSRSPPSAEPDAMWTYVTPAGPTVDFTRPGGLRYRILRHHARGGLGEVFVAEDIELHREVALKEIRSEHAQNPFSRGRFVLEAEVTGGLEHPNIVPVYGLGVHEDGRPYYAMRFIRGDSLSRAIERFHHNAAAEVDGQGGGEKGTPVPAPARPSSVPAPDFTGLEFRGLLRRFIDVCNAVAYAHARGVLHRDLKPSNVMLGKFGETLVVDWGLAKLMGSDDEPAEPRADVESPLKVSFGSGSTPTQAGSAIGTPAYMSPEQAAGKHDELGPASDIYSLGATLYSLLTNRNPVGGRDLDEVLTRVRDGRTGFAQFDGGQAASMPKAPEPLVAVCRKAMSVNPGERYATASQIVADIEHWLADEPVSCYREPLLTRAGRFARRHRSLVSTALGVGLVAILALAAGLMLVGGYNRRLEQANQELQERKLAAEENFTLALDAVKSQVFDINRELSDRSGTRALREKLEKNATERLKKLVVRASNRADVDYTSLWAHVYLGDVHLYVDLRFSEALAEYERAAAIARQLAAADPTAIRPQHDLAIACERLGDVHRQLGRPARAAEYYEECLAHSRIAADADPSDVQAQRQLSVSYDRLGGLARQMGNLPKALEYSTHGHEISRKLADRDPADVDAQRDLAVSLERMGDLALGLGQPDQALEYHRQALDINRKLSAEHPANSLMQRDLSIAYDRLGNLSLRARDLEAALDYFNQGLSIRKQRVAADPSDARAQHDLAISYDFLGKASLQLGQNEEAREYFRQALDIRKGLPADPDDTQAQAGLSISHYLLGDMEVVAGREEAASSYYKESLAIISKVAEAGRGNAEIQFQVFAIQWRLADVAIRRCRFIEGLEWLDRAQERIEILDREERLTADQRSWLVSLHHRTATCKVLARLQPGILDDPAWMLLWSRPLF